MGRGECPFKEVSSGKVSGRESIRRGTVLWGSLSLSSAYGEVSVEELSKYQSISKTF